MTSSGRRALLVATVSVALGGSAGAAGGEPPGGGAVATVRAIRLESIDSGDRVVIVLSREVAYAEDRLSNPERVFFDFADAEPHAVLASHAAVVTGRFVERLRVGRHATMTRVVLDLKGTPRYRAYPVANPFRLVVDIVDGSRTGPAAAAVTGGVPTDAGVRFAAADAAPAPYLGTLTTFQVARPPSEPPPDAAPVVQAAPTFLPNPNENLRTSVGLGYVDGVDWGSEFMAIGSHSGIQVQLDGLVTRGDAGVRLERGSLSLSDVDRGWRIEAGDLFSYLRGAARGLRVSWRARGNRRPSVGLIGSRFGLADRPPVAVYRDQLRWRDQTLVDVEVASDRSFFSATRWSLGRVDAELSYRTTGSGATRVIDRTAALGVQFGRGVAVQISGIRTDEPQGRSDWLSAGIRVPVRPWLEVGFERTFSTTGPVTASGSAVMAGLYTSDLRLSHRYQWGETGLFFGDVSRTIAREQYQGMAAWTPGPRLSATLQMVTAWNDHGRAVTWEELQTSVAVTRTTALSLATPMQPIGDRDRTRVRLVQALPRGFALAADYGRVAPFQFLSADNGRPRLRLMVSRTVDLATPARGGHVAGRVLDHAGRPVAGVRVTLGPYAVTTDTTGEYVFHPLPPGTFDLEVDDRYLPAAYAWDGRRVRLDVARTTRLQIDLGVTPLNAIHGRVYVDRNANGAYDIGEGVQGAVLRLAGRVTASAEDGAYSFYNVWPGDHRVVLDPDHLPAGLIAGETTGIDLVLTDLQPATRIDFPVAVFVRPIRWGGGGGR